MCEFLRRLNHPKYLTSYNRTGSNDEKEKSDLVKELDDSVSIFKTTDKSEIALVLAAQSAGRMGTDDIEYSIIGGMATIDKHLVNKGTPWNGANQLHYELRSGSMSDKIIIADAIFDGQDVDYVVSSTKLIEAVWDLINNYGVSQDEFKYMRGRTK